MAAALMRKFDMMEFYLSLVAFDMIVTKIRHFFVLLEIWLSYVEVLT
jgi:hypothetical protein